MSSNPIMPCSSKTKQKNLITSQKWSLNIAAITAITVSAISLWRDCLVDGVKVGIRGHSISAWWHSLIDSVQAFRFFKARDLMLWRESFDSYTENRGGKKTNNKRQKEMEVNCGKRLNFFLKKNLLIHFYLSAYSSLPPHSETNSFAVKKLKWQYN